MKPEQMKRWRQKRKFTMAQAAAWAGTSFETWKAYEYGLRTIKPWLPKMIRMQKTIDRLEKQLAAR